MSTTGAQRRSYLIHGVAVDVSTPAPAILDAIDVRFRDFACAPATPSPTEISFEFVIDGDDAGGVEAVLARGGGRPVYDTPFGTLCYSPESDVIGGELAGVQLRCQPERGTCTLRGSTLTGRQLYLATHPLTTIALMEMLERRGLYSLHAACVAPRAGRGVLIAGASGAGKSTLALALARSGVPFLSDDIVFLADAAPGPRVRALGFADTVGLTSFASERFEELRDRLREPPAEGFPKRLGRIEELFGVPALRVCEPAALVFPEIVQDDRSRLAPLAPSAALLRLVPDVLVTHAAATQAHLAAIASLLDQVSCYELRSGTDIERSVELICQLT